MECTSAEVKVFLRPVEPLDDFIAKGEYNPIIINSVVNINNWVKLARRDCRLIIDGYVHLLKYLWL